MTKKSKGKWADDDEVNRRFEELFHPSPEKFKNELHYDAKIWLAEREADFKEPFELMIAFALICAEHAVDVLLLLRDLKRVVGLGRESSPIRLRMCFGLYALSAVHQKMRNLPDDEWNGWPVTRGSHCFEFNELSTLSALDVFCLEVEIASFSFIFGWVWSVTGRPVDCDPVLCVIESAIKDAGILNFIEWCGKFNLNVFTDSEIFPGSAGILFPEIIPDKCDPGVERDRVMLELQHEHYEAKADLSKAEKPAASGDETGEKSDRQSITLKNFINTYCNLSRKPVVESKVELLLKYNRKELITLPPLATTHRRGQSKFYYVDDLKSKWAEYQKKISTLPPLKG